MININLNVEKASEEQVARYKEIFEVLISKGALDGVKGGNAIIHFDSKCIFQGVELVYWPWRRRKPEKDYDL